MPKISLISLGHLSITPADRAAQITLGAGTRGTADQPEETFDGFAEPPNSAEPDSGVDDPGLYGQAVSFRDHDAQVKSNRISSNELYSADLGAPSDVLGNVHRDDEHSPSNGARIGAIGNSVYASHDDVAATPAQPKYTELADATLYDFVDTDGVDI